MHAFNQRSIAGILAMISTLGAIVAAAEKADRPGPRTEARLAEVAGRSRGWRPRVFFEEWDEPLISGICWVSELIEVAGGVDVFAHLRGAAAAKDRIVTPEMVVAAP